MNFRSSASFGKRQEYVAVAELLRRGHDVYMTLVDDQQIDCVIRQEKDGELRYLDIQIKARSKDCAPKNAGTFAAMEIRKPRENFYFIFYSEQANFYWVIPSLELVKEARQNKSGQNQGRYTINFCNVTKGGVSPRPRFRQYENSFDLLEWTDRSITEIGQMSHGVDDVPKEKVSGCKKEGNFEKADCWQEVRKLQGQTLKTLNLGREFDILQVTDSKVEIFIHSSENPRTIRREEIEGACRELRIQGEITRTEIQQHHSSNNPAYVAAILASLPGVGYSQGPIRLYY